MIYFLGRVVKSHLSDVPPFMYAGGTYIYEDVKNSRDAFDGRGTQVSLSFTHHAKGRPFAFAIEPFLRDWLASHSDEKTVMLIPVDGISSPLYSTALEPKNTTRLFGVKVPLHFVRF